MRAILLILLLLLVGCGPSDLYNLVGHRRFKAGDCLVQSYDALEEWEKKQPEYRIVEIGENSYHVKSIVFGLGTTEKIQFGHLWEDFYQKVDCQ